MPTATPPPDKSPLQRGKKPTPRRRWLAVLGLAAAGSAHAVDFGPISVNGFVKAEATRVSPYCPHNDCQRDPLATKEFVWADELVQGKTYGAGTTHVTLLQPYLGAKYDLPAGWRASALVSQRWRDGKPDFKGFWYEKNAALSHDDYGSVRVGAMTTRAWSMADYPFGTDIGLADPWGSSGAGYGILTRAVRYTARTFDVAEGDLVLEGTYDMGKSGWSNNKPRFFELWAHWGGRDLALDLMLQDAKNGTPSAFSHGPFASLFYDSRFDSKLGSSSQGIAMLMARYRLDARFELMGGLRRNRWSGAYAVLLESRTVNPGGYDIWSNPFNVDWSRDLGGGVYKGYPATSVDVVMGGRWKSGPWAASAGLLHLGKASTDNPTDRGGSNSATLGTLGLHYDFGQGLQVYGNAGMIEYAHQGLSPISMPSNSAFTGVDSRIKKHGNWFGAGVVYQF